MVLVALWRSLGTCALLVAAFFLVPVSTDDDGAVWRAIVTLLIMALAVWLIYRQIRRQVDDPVAPLAGLMLAIVGGVLIFAFIDYEIAVERPGEFVDLATRLDALYFALTTLATVGYGDVHAEGQLARGVLCAQLLFNIVVVGAAASILVSQLRSRVRAPRP
ncbi:Ca2+/Na+ antiporter [Allocatelliglobosispora scoriae]|uniref:Ca2+/Na+ antiporter n=1 Tax=Allocatelliglobosispora scoriae TaxID=643052 RepID=A0A841BYS7_9ACTN|nr:potassium channel family protein [Allocatelliglobosispora scoriae]MBB5872825.1 Ca2+/Na+ antiporter [Allocatelliglobosispora scoriae]